MRGRRLRNLVRRRPYSFSAFLFLATFGFYKYSGIEDYVTADSFAEFRWPPYVHLKQKVAENPPSMDAIFHATGVNLVKNSPKLQNFTKGNTEIKLRILVKSLFSNFEARSAIRSTWGADALRSGVELFFVVGIPVTQEAFSFREPWPNNKLYLMSSFRQLWKEAEETKDLLIGNFIDTYRNNTRKFVLSVAAAAGLLPNLVKSEFTLLLDDDYILNVSRNVYPYDHYPPYITAGAVFLSADTIHQFAAAIPYVQLYMMDDIYTGILAYLLKIEPIHDPRFIFWEQGISKHDWNSIIAAHGYSPGLLRQVYTHDLKLV